MKRTDWQILAILILTLIGTYAKGDNVYVCTKPGATGYYDCGDVNVKIVNTIQPTDLVATTTGSGNQCYGSASFWNCSTFKWTQAKELTDDTQVGFCGGTLTTLDACARGNGGLSAVAIKKSIVGITWASAWKFSGYDCKPSSEAAVWTYTNDNGEGDAWWVCDGLQLTMQVYCFQDKGARGKSWHGTWAALVAFLVKGVNRPCTAGEKAAHFYALGQGLTLRAWVTNSTVGAVDAPAYFANDDHTRASTVIARIDLKDASGNRTECMWSDRLITITNGVKAPTSYYAVWDAKTNKVMEIGGKQVYANCKLDGIVSK